MERSDLEHSPGYYLEPGYIYLTKGSVVIRTVVGSCVAVCLWDRKLGYGGMNHFLRPIIRDAESATPKYGNVATIALITMMEEAGCEAKDIVGQILGGACPQDANEADMEDAEEADMGDEKEADVGHENVAIARSVLQKKGIAIVSEDVGGNMGRKVVFDTETGQLMTLKVHKIRDSDWMTGLSEKQYEDLCSRTS